MIVNSKINQEVVSDGFGKRVNEIADQITKLGVDYPESGVLFSVACRTKQGLIGGVVFGGDTDMMAASSKNLFDRLCELPDQE